MTLRIVVLLALCTAVHALPGAALYGGNGGKKPVTCTAKYETMENSTMCYFGENDMVSEDGVSAEDRNLILDAHNNYRANVSPTAQNMLKMYWDEEIAVIAQHYADTCPKWHDSNDNRKVPGYGIGIGQNMAWGFRSWSLAIEGWHSEVSRFHYGGSNYVYDVGHYTQVVSFKDNRIGCGYAMCDWAIYVCNYGNGPAYINKPYKEGPSCSSCPGKCENNLCDCGDLICKNGGTLDVTTCSCSCAPNYKGTMCEELDCPASDGGSCSWYEKHGGIGNCEKYANIPQECPYMCGICPGEVVTCEDDLWYCSRAACPYVWFGGERDGESVKDTCKKTCDQC